MEVGEAIEHERVLLVGKVAEHEAELSALRACHVANMDQENVPTM